MRKALRKILKVNRKELVDNITLDETLWNMLLVKNILNENQRDKIKSKETMNEQIGALLDFIKRRSDKVFDDLCQCLCDTNQAHAADILSCSVVRSPGPAPSVKRGPNVEAAAGNQKRTRIDPSLPSNPPSSRGPAPSVKRGPNVEAAAGNQKRPRIDPSLPSNPPSSRELPAPSGASCSQECPSPEKGTDSDGSISCLPQAFIVSLRHHANTISERLSPIDYLLTLLVKEKCMNPRDKQLILEKDADQASDLVEFIIKSHLRTYKVFLKFLQCTQQSHLFTILNTNKIDKIGVELYMNSFVYNELESRLQLFKQVLTDICGEESKISNLFKSIHPHLEALSVDIGSMIIYVWSPCPGASTCLQKACDSGDLRQRIQSVLIHITGTCLYEPRVVETCIYDKTQPSPVSSLTLDTNPYKVSQLSSSTAALSDATTWRDSGSPLFNWISAELSKAGSISPEVAFHVQEMTRLMEELGLERDMSTKVEAVVCSNTGSYDLLLNSLVGVFGNSKYHRLLTPILGAVGVDGTASKRARYVVGMILKSNRRFFKNGIEFCFRVVASSQQWDRVDELMERILPQPPTLAFVFQNAIGTRWLTSDDPHTLMAADILRLSEMEANPVRLQVSGLGNAKYYPHATSVVHEGEITAAALMKKFQYLNNVTSICFKSAAITNEVTEVLSRITRLEALCFVDTELGLPLYWLWFKNTVQYLRLSSCGLKSKDVSDLLKAFGKLRHLDISGNAAIKHKMVWSESSLTGLSVEGTNLTDDDLTILVAGSKNSLVFLNASSFSMSKESCCEILQLCPHLREFYVRGDGLLEALGQKVQFSIGHMYFTGYAIKMPSVHNLLEHQLLSCIIMCDDSAQLLMSHIPEDACCRIKSLFVDVHEPRPVFFENLLNLMNLTQLWIQGNIPWEHSDVARLFEEMTSLQTVGIQMEPSYAELFLKALKRPLKRLWLVVSKKEDFAYVIEETEKRLGATPGMIQLVTDPDGLYGTCTRESGMFYTHLPDTLPNDFRPVIKGNRGRN